jgi:hypothetical protein
VPSRRCPLPESPREAHETLLADLDGLDPLLLTLSEEELERSDPETRFLIRVYPHLDDIVLLFTLFHDSMGLNDGRNPPHGPRGAALVRELRGEAFELEGAATGLLGFACEEHTNGGVDPDPTVGVCWDSDRLILWRVGIRPDPRWLSTKSARSEEPIMWARGRSSSTCSTGSSGGNRCHHGHHY